MSRVVIIGGGITGLSAAWALRQSPIPPEIILLEQSDRLGGCIYTERYKGFLMEHGPDIFLSRKPEALNLCTSLGLSIQDTNDNQRGVYLRRDHSLYALPEGMSGLVPCRIWPLLSSPLLSFQAKIRVLSELFIPPRKNQEDESVSDFFTRRFGQGAFTKLIAPLLRGLIGGAPEHLSLHAVLPHLPALESRYGSIILGAAQTRISDSSSSLKSLSNGLSSIIDALHERNKSSIHLHKNVVGLTRSNSQWMISLDRDHSFLANHVILAVPACKAARICKSLNSDLHQLLSRIPSRGGTMIHLAYPNNALQHWPLHGHGHLVDPDEGSPVIACTWSTSKFTGRSPADSSLFRLYLQGVDLSDKDMIAYAHKEMQLSHGVTHAPLLAKVHRHPDTLPQYILGHRDRIRKILEITRIYDGLHLAGNYLRGVGIPDCIRSGVYVANQVLDRDKQKDGKYKDVTLD